MNFAVVSYSLTGNNKALAGSAAKELSAEHINISESKSRTMGTIILDMLFGRIPAVQPEPSQLEKYDIILFVSPIWMGQTASPLRPYLKYLKEHTHKYAFASISGGTLGPNPKLSGELKKRTGAEPAALIDLHIADLMPGLKPTMKNTSAYRINEDDIKKLTETIVNAVKKII